MKGRHAWGNRGATGPSGRGTACAETQRECGMVRGEGQPGQGQGLLWGQNLLPFALQNNYFATKSYQAPTSGQTLKKKKKLFQF